MSLVGAFNPFVFKVIIDKYDPLTIYFIVLGLFEGFFCVSCLEKFFYYIFKRWIGIAEI